MFVGLLLGKEDNISSSTGFNKVQAAMTCNSAIYFINVDCDKYIRVARNAKGLAP